MPKLFCGVCRTTDHNTAGCPRLGGVTESVPSIIRKRPPSIESVTTPSVTESVTESTAPMMESRPLENVTPLLKASRGGQRLGAGRKAVYESHAARQRAYRERHGSSELP